VPEPIKAFEVVLTSVTGGKLDRATAAVTIVDDDAPTAQSALTLSPSVTTVAEGNSGTHDIPVNVTVTGFTQQTASVKYSWYENANDVHTGTLQFAPGEAQKSFSVSYASNTTPEPDRVINIRLSDPTGATIAVDRATITITDDDYAIVSIEDATVSENAGSVNVWFVLSQISLKPVTVTFTTVPSGAAVNGVDYVGKQGTIVFNQPVTRIPVSIPIINNATIDPTRTFAMIITASTNGGFDNRWRATVTILDDDEITPLPPPPGTPAHRRSTRH
jgi:hypothetical protein